MYCLPLLSFLLFAPSDFEGVWDTEFGRLELDVQGDVVFGICGQGQPLESRRAHRILGRVEGKRLVTQYTGIDGSGEAWFELTPEGDLLGQWVSAEPEQGQGPWTGSRVSGVQPSSAFAGLWSTNFGQLRISGVEDELIGVYEPGHGCSLTGKVQDGVFRFRYRDPESTGSGSFRLTGDGARLEGHWRAEGSAKAEPWLGTRVEPEKDKVWLVILEAPWETSLGEPEYAFGSMLRSHFRMEPARHVQVRQRSVHDAEDFQRFLGEIHFLAEPVVLVVASHGIQAGISVNGSVIGPKLVAESLRPADHLVLLHLSGCSMLKGSFPERLHAALGPRSRLPVSGYSTVVAWDSSALADYLFLTLLLIRGLSPQEAIEQSHRLAPFTAESAPEDSAFEPLGLGIRLAG